MKEKHRSNERKRKVWWKRAKLSLFHSICLNFVYSVCCYYCRRWCYCCFLYHCHQLFLLCIVGVHTLHCLSSTDLDVCSMHTHTHDVDWKVFGRILVVCGCWYTCCRCNLTPYFLSRTINIDINLGAQRVREREWNQIHNVKKATTTTTTTATTKLQQCTKIQWSDLIELFCRTYFYLQAIGMV